MAIDAGHMIAVAASSVVLPLLGQVVRLSGCLVMPLAIILSVVIGHMVLMLGHPGIRLGPTYSVAIFLNLIMSSVVVVFVYSLVEAERYRRLERKRRRVRQAASVKPNSETSGGGA
jgi:hypothetical protein